MAWLNGHAHKEHESRGLPPPPEPNKGGVPVSIVPELAELLGWPNLCLATSLVMLGVSRVYLREETSQESFRERKGLEGKKSKSKRTRWAKSTLTTTCSYKK